MKTKPKSHDAAQRKLWKAELKQLHAAGRKVAQDYAAELKRLEGEVSKAKRKLDQFRARAEKQTGRAFDKIDARAAVLRGRLGL